jgi:hypothetical protein
LVDSLLAGGCCGTTAGNTSTKSGYTFFYSLGTPDVENGVNHYDYYAFTANPVSPSTGTNYYYTDQSGVLRQNSTAEAYSTDSPIAG